MDRLVKLWIGSRNFHRVPCPRPLGCGPGRPGPGPGTPRKGLDLAEELPEPTLARVDLYLRSSGLQGGSVSIKLNKEGTDKANTKGEPLDEAPLGEAPVPMEAEAPAGGEAS